MLMKTNIFNGDPNDLVNIKRIKNEVKNNSLLSNLWKLKSLLTEEEQFWMANRGDFLAGLNELRRAIFLPNGSLWEAVNAKGSDIVYELPAGHKDNRSSYRLRQTIESTLCKKLCPGGKSRHNARKEKVGKSDYLECHIADQEIGFYAAISVPKKFQRRLKFNQSSSELFFQWLNNKGRLLVPNWKKGKTYKTKEEFKELKSYFYEFLKNQNGSKKKSVSKATKNALLAFKHGWVRAYQIGVY